MKPLLSSENLRARARCAPTMHALTASLLLGLALETVTANIDPAEDINAVIPLKPSQPTGQFPKQGDDERLAPNYTFTVDVQITEQEQIGQAIWNRVGPVKATTQTPDPNLFWTEVENATIYHLTNTAQTTGLATLDVTCRWQRQAAGGAGPGAVASIDGRAGVVIALLDSVVHWEFSDKVIALADGNAELLVAYKLLDEAGRGLERWEPLVYGSANPIPDHVQWDFDEINGEKEWERTIQVKAVEPARAEILVHYNDGSHQVRVSEEQTLTFFTAELKVVADGEEDAEEVTLGKSLKLTAEFVPADFEAELYRFEASYEDQDDFRELQAGQLDIYSDFARISGFFDLRLVIHYNQGDGAYATPLEGLKVRFPNYHEIVAVEALKQKFDRLWQDSLEFANADRKREFGGWVLFDSINLEFDFMDMPPGPEVSPDELSQIDLGERPDDVPEVSQLHPGSPGARYVIASFHTHPPQTWALESRPVGPSFDDQMADANADVTGVVYDYEAVINEDGGSEPPLTKIPSGHLLEGDYKPYRSGPEKRSTQ